MEHNVSPNKKLTLLNTGNLKNGTPYLAVLLDASHAGPIAALHAAMIGALKPDEKTFLLPKSEEYFALQLGKGGGNAVIGIISDGQLIAQALIRHPTPEHTETGMVAMEPVAAPETLSILQAVSVLPAYRNLGLMGVLFGHWLDHARKHQRTHLLGEIEIRNLGSWINFLKGGLDLVGIGIDPASGVLVYNAYETLEQAKQKRISPVFNTAAQSSLFICRAAHIERQQALFRRGYHCIAYSKPAVSLIFMKPEK